jgi:hypothetical protein
MPFTDPTSQFHTLDDSAASLRSAIPVSQVSDVTSVPDTEPGAGDPSELDWLFEHLGKQGAFSRRKEATPERQSPPRDVATTSAGLSANQMTIHSEGATQPLSCDTDLDPSTKRSHISDRGEILPKEGSKKRRKGRLSRAKGGQRSYLPSDSQLPALLPAKEAIASEVTNPDEGSHSNATLKDFSKWGIVACKVLPDSDKAVKQEQITGDNAGKHLVSFTIVPPGGHGRENRRSTTIRVYLLQKHIDWIRTKDRGNVEGPGSGQAVVDALSSKKRRFISLERWAEENGEPPVDQRALYKWISEEAVVMPIP